MTVEQSENLLLLERYKKGDASAKDEIVQKNLPLVKSILRRMHTCADSYEDLLQTGTMGLLKAIDGFDASLGNAFSTYAFTLITGEIKRYLRDNSMVKVSRLLKKNAAIVLAQKEKYLRLYGKEPTLSTLSCLCSLSCEDIVQCLDAVSPVRSTDEQVSEDDSRRLCDTLCADDEISPLIDRLALFQALEGLEDVEKQLMSLRFFKNLTQTQAAKILGISQVTVSRMEKKILQKLKSKLI